MSPYTSGGVPWWFFSLHSACGVSLIHFHK